MPGYTLQDLNRFVVTAKAATKEWISRRGVTVYELVYHGGLVR